MVINPLSGFGNPFEFSVNDSNYAFGTNPQDIELASATKAYISLLATNYILVVNPQTGQEIKKIDISAYADSPDGIPEAAGMTIVGNRLFVALQKLNTWSCYNPTDTGKILVIDTVNDTL